MCSSVGSSRSSTCARCPIPTITRCPRKRTQWRYELARMFLAGRKTAPVSRPTLAAITLTPKGDGVAVVARLLHDAVRRHWGGECEVVTMFSGPAGQPSVMDKIGFATRLAENMLLRRPPWMLFSHLGLARAIRFVPDAMRPPYGVFLHGKEVWKPLRTADRILLGGAAV